MKLKQSRIHNDYADVDTIAKRVAKRTGFSERDVKEVCRTFVEECIDILKSGIDVRIHKLVFFTISYRKALKSVNPRKPDEINLNPDMMSIHASVADSLKKGVRSNTELLAKYKKENNIE